MELATNLLKAGGYKRDHMPVGGSKVVRATFSFRQLVDAASLRKG